MLFILFLDNIIKNIKDKTKKVEAAYYNLTRMTISECVFADDLAILTKSEEDMKHNLKVWNEELNKHNMAINTEITKIMVIAREDILTDIINGKGIEQVETFTYLGITLNNKGSLEDEI